ncbi:MAG: aryldialkylphosphatase [SAR202 cluster bacterium]|nr:aryldialkylphosphatase [SAR202 cluster bacterium]
MPARKHTASRKRSPLSSKVQTVLGPIAPQDLGITMTHEHLLIDLGCYFEPPEGATEREWVHAPLTVKRRGGIWRRGHVNLDQMRLWDERTAVEEVSRYARVGGRAIVDTTSIGIGRDPLALARISRATGLNIIMGAGHYVPVSYPPDMDARSEESIAQGIVKDLTVSVGDTSVRAGVIGEIGLFWPMGDNERKVLGASAHAQQETGAAILIHPGFHPEAPLEIMRVLTAAGASPDRVIVGHLDYIHDMKAVRRLAETGCYLEYDTFGEEDTSFNGTAPQPVIEPNDDQRIEKLEAVTSAGYLDRLLVANDVCMKAHLVRYGGKGYAHVLENIVPRMRKRGWTQQQLDTILIHNPARALTFA